MRKTTVYLSDEELGDLRRESAATGRSVAALIREGVRLVTRDTPRRFASRGVAAGDGTPGGRNLDERLRQSLKPRE